MDQRAYATLFPREHFEKFICGAAKKDDDDVAARQHQQQQMVLPGVRPEGHRPLGRARRVQFGLAELGNNDNNGAGVLCHLKSTSSKGGKKTTVLCASRMERAKVNPRFPEEGFVEVNVEIGACSRVENGSFSSTSERATRVARLIRETVFPRKGGLLDWNVLKEGGGGGGGKSSSGEKDACWKFVVECLVLDDDMGTLDACLAAAVACARKTRAPTSTESESREEKNDDNDDHNEKDGKEKKQKKRKMMLAVNRDFKPVCLTVGAFTLSAENSKGEDKQNSKNGKKRKMNEDEKDEELGEEKKEDEEDEIEDYEPPKQIVIVDPTYEETKLCDAFVNVIVDENGNVLGLEKSNQHGVASSEIDETVLAKAIAAAKLRHGEVWKRIEQFDEIGEDDEE